MLSHGYLTSAARRDHRLSDDLAGPEFRTTVSHAPVILPTVAICNLRLLSFCQVDSAAAIRAASEYPNGFLLGERADVDEFVTLHDMVTHHVR